MTEPARKLEIVTDKKELSDIYLAKKFFTDLYFKDYGVKYGWTGKDTGLFNGDEGIWKGLCQEDLLTWQKKVVAIRLQIEFTPKEKRIFKLRDKETYTIPYLNMVWNELPQVPMKKICKDCYQDQYSCQCSDFITWGEYLEENHGL